MLNLNGINDNDDDFVLSGVGGCGGEGEFVV